MTESNDVVLPVERILAAILQTTGPVDVPVELIISDFNNYAVAVDQVDDEMLNFSLVEVKDES